MPFVCLVEAWHFLQRHATTTTTNDDFLFWLFFIFGDKCIFEIAAALKTPVVAMLWYYKYWFFLFLIFLFVDFEFLNTFSFEIAAALKTPIVSMLWYYKCWFFVLFDFLFLNTFSFKIAAALKTLKLLCCDITNADFVFLFFRFFFKVLKLQQRWKHLSRLCRAATKFTHHSTI